MLLLLQLYNPILEVTERAAKRERDTKIIRIAKEKKKKFSSFFGM